VGIGDAVSGRGCVRESEVVCVVEERTRGCSERTRGCERVRLSDVRVCVCVCMCVCVCAGEGVWWVSGVSWRQSEKWYNVSNKSF